MKFHHRLLAAAIGAAFAPALHAESVVEMYGTVMPFLDNAKTTGATAAAPADRPSQLAASAYTGANDPARWRMSAGTSNWGFRGSEDLGQGMKAVWQLESGFQVDQNTGPGIGARNSKVGLQCQWGEVFFGQWDTPYKFISLQINPLRAGYVFDYTAVMGNPGMGVPATTTQPTRIGAKPDAAFDKRAGNSVQYWTPKFGGFSARLGWSVAEGKGPLTAGGPIVSPEIYSAALQYDVGGLSARYGYEQHNDYFGMAQIGGSLTGADSSRDRAHKVVVIWRLGDTRLAAAIEQLTYRNNNATAISTLGLVNEYKRRAYYALLEQRFGNHSLWGSYSRANDGSCTRVGGAACSTRDLGADYWAVGWIYRFSKRTEVFATYYRLNNKASGTYSPQPIVGASIAPGADTVAAGVGIIHFF
jgi:predicted porin